MPSAKSQGLASGIVPELAQLGPVILDRSFTREEFMAIADRYPDLQIEREKNGKIIVTPPVKAGSGERESVVLIFLGMWRYKTGKGKVKYEI